MALWRKSLSFSCSNCERQTKYSCITCGKSVCVRSECSIPEVNEEAIGWQPNNVLGIVSSVLFVQKSLSKIVRAKWMTKSMVRGILQHVFAKKKKKKKKKSQISSRKVKW